MSNITHQEMPKINDYIHMILDNPKSYKTMPMYVKTNYVIIRSLISYDASLWKWVPKKRRYTYSICILAVRRDPRMMMLMPENYQNDDKFVLKCVGDCSASMFLSNYSDEIYIKAIKKEPFLYRHGPVSVVGSKEAKRVILDYHPECSWMIADQNDGLSVEETLEILKLCPDAGGYFKSVPSLDINFIIEALRYSREYFMSLPDECKESPEFVKQLITEVKEPLPMMNTKLICETLDRMIVMNAVRYDKRETLHLLGGKFDYDYEVLLAANYCMNWRYYPKYLSKLVERYRVIEWLTSWVELKKGNGLIIYNNDCDLIINYN